MNEQQRETIVRPHVVQECNHLNGVAALVERDTLLSETRGLGRRSLWSSIVAWRRAGWLMLVRGGAARGEGGQSPAG